MKKISDREVVLVKTTIPEAKSRSMGSYICPAEKFVMDGKFFAKDVWEELIFAKRKQIRVLAYSLFALNVDKFRLSQKFVL